MKFELSTFKTVSSCSLMMIANYSLSAQETFKINQETTRKISIENINIYPVDYKEIEYYPYVDAKVFTESYQNFLDSQKDVKEEYSEALSIKNKYDDVKNNKLKIKQLIQGYLDSKNEKLLDEADRLSKELNLKLIIDDQSLIYSGWGVKPKKTLFIKNDSGKYASKIMFKEYLGALNIEISKYRDYNISYKQEKYDNVRQEDDGFSDDEKYTIGKVKSNVLNKRKAYIMSENRVNDFSEIYGTYREISKTLSIANENIEDKFIINELSDKVNKHYGRSEFFSTALIQNIDSGKFFVMSYGAYQEIKLNIDYQKFEKQLNSLGYKAYYAGPLLQVNTKYYKVEVSNFLYKKLESDKLYLLKLDEHYIKIQNLSKKCSSYNSSFEKYIRLYKIQGNRMSKADISAWTALTNSGLKLLRELSNLKSNTIEVVHYPLDQSYYKQDELFSDYVAASRNILNL